MAKKEFSFRGKAMGELGAMDAQEFAKLLNSRGKRSLRRAGADKGMLRRIDKARKTLAAGTYPKPIRTHKRDTVITPQMVGLRFGVYTGREFTNVDIVPEMLGHYLGEMALTRKKIMHGKAGIGATRSSTAIQARK